MERFSKLTLFVALLVLCCGMTLLARADSSTPESDFSQQELDQMLAPIALYPDALLSQILMASTYPQEVVEAANWSREHRNLNGETAVLAVEQNDWDASVKSLAAFPQVLSMMGEKPDWTERLGEAFMAQQAQVMDTIQALRRKAIQAGYLVSNDKLRVEQQGDIIVITQVDPQMMYVPYYDPTVAYGTWGLDAYPPVYWEPWPDYSYSPVYDGLFWGGGIFIGSSVLFGAFDWRHRHACIVNFDNFHRHHFRDGHRDGSWQVRHNVVDSWWHHDAEHRHGIPFHNSWLRNRFQQTNVAPAVMRNDSSTLVTRSLPRNEILINPMNRTLSGTTQTFISSPATRSTLPIRDERRREVLKSNNLGSRALPVVSTQAPASATATVPAAQATFSTVPTMRSIQPMSREWRGLEDREISRGFRGQAAEAPSRGMSALPQVRSNSGSSNWGGASPLTGRINIPSQERSIGGGQGIGHHRSMNR